jgi:hypothetical protein
LNGCNGLGDGTKVGGVLELGNEDAHGRDHGLDERLWHWLVFGRVDTNECFPEVIAEVCGMLTEVVGPCCHLRPRCRHAACVTLGNAYTLGLVN